MRRLRWWRQKQFPLNRHKNKYTRNSHLSHQGGGSPHRGPMNTDIAVHPRRPLEVGPPSKRRAQNLRHFRPVPDDLHATFGRQRQRGRSCWCFDYQRRGRRRSFLHLYLLERSPDSVFGVRGKNRKRVHLLLDCGRNLEKCVHLVTGEGKRRRASCITTKVAGWPFFSLTVLGGDVKTVKKTT